MKIEGKEQLTSNTKLTLEGGEFNLNLLLKALSKNNIKITSMNAVNSTIGAEKRVDASTIPVETATLVVDAPESAVREALKNTEFHDRIDTIFGHGLN